MKEGRYIMLDVKDLYKESYIGKEITVSGWIKTKWKVLFKSMYEN